MAVLSSEPGNWQAPGWLQSAQGAPAAAQAESSSNSDSSSSSSDGSEEEHASLYSDLSGEDEQPQQQRGAKSGAMAHGPDQAPMAPGLPHVSLQPLTAQEADGAANLPENHDQESELRAEEAAREEAEREERRRAAELRRLDAILGGKGDISRARQRLLQVWDMLVNFDPYVHHGSAAYKLLPGALPVRCPFWRCQRCYGAGPCTLVLCGACHNMCLGSEYTGPATCWDVSAGFVRARTGAG